jgi:hypothetical protein
MCSWVRGVSTFITGATEMDLATWLPGLFALGLISILACLAFTEGCTRI